MFHSSRGIPLPSLSVGAWEHRDTWTLLAQWRETIQDRISLGWLPMVWWVPKLQRCSSKVYFGRLPASLCLPTQRCHLILWHLHCHVSLLQLFLLDLHFSCWCTDSAEGKLFQGWEQFPAHFSLLGNLLGSTHPVLRKTALRRHHPRGLNWRGCRMGTVPMRGLKSVTILVLRAAGWEVSWAERGLCPPSQLWSRDYEEALRHG